MTTGETLKSSLLEELKIRSFKQSFYYFIKLFYRSCHSYREDFISVYEDYLKNFSEFDLINKNLSQLILDLTDVEYALNFLNEEMLFQTNIENLFYIRRDSQIVSLLLKRKNELCQTIDKRIK